ncbi:unnamed protein product [Ilex paraguariensis]|uniref:Uncharacterized protein n=1 Tax=Ilex paraguariensis TaxID=185542 RepID=A0ABC8T7V9_9AQUA
MGGKRETTAGKEEEVRRATAFGRQSATSAVRRRVALAHTILASDCSDMNERPSYSVYSRDISLQLQAKQKSIYEEELLPMEEDREEMRGRERGLYIDKRVVCVEHTDELWCWLCRAGVLLALGELPWGHCI